MKTARLVLINFVLLLFCDCENNSHKNNSTLQGKSCLTVSEINTSPPKMLFRLTQENGVDSTFSDNRKVEQVDDEWSEILTGNVSIYWDSLHITCDTAIWFRNKNLLEIPGKLSIQSQEIFLIGRAMLLHPGENVNYEIKNVEIKLFIEYSLNEKIEKINIDSI